MASSRSAAAPLTPGGLTRSQTMGALAGVLLGILLSALDQTIVGTALPKVIAQLQGLDRYAWVFTAYMLTSTASMPIWGKLSDIYGRKWLYMLGMAIFVLGSALSGASQSMNQLILFRAIQGLGAGAMLPISLSIIGDIFPPAERGKYQGLTGAVFGVASIFGPALGGYITDSLNWRWVFYINVPVGIVALIVVYLTLPNFGLRTQHVVDYLGAALLVVGIVTLLLAFTWAGTEYAWLSVQILGLIALSIVLLSLFVWVESRAQEAILPLTLFRNDIFSVSSFTSFLTGIGMFGPLLFIPLFVQGVLGQSATASGAVITPTLLSFVAASIVSGQLMSRWGRYKIISVVGLSVATLGIFLLSRMTTSTSLLTVTINMIIMGLGLGSVMALFTIIVQNAVDYRFMGVATSSITFFRSIGGTIGAAILGSFLSSTFASQLMATMPVAVAQAVPEERLADIHDPQALLDPQSMAMLRNLFAGAGAQADALLAQLLDAIRSALMVALHDVFLVATIIMAVAVVSAFFLREIPLKRSHKPGFADAMMEGGGEMVLDARPVAEPPVAP
ncbi:MAG: MDR family MFS transporter [Anaerolineae bacterium]